MAYSVGDGRERREDGLAAGVVSSEQHQEDGEGRKRFPKGVVLGADGKPCRTCTSFASWAALNRKQTQSSQNAAASSSITTTTTTTTTTATAAAAEPSLEPATDTVPRDCPPDVLTLGRHTWTLLHSIAATYPRRPTLSAQSDAKLFLGTFSRLYPCWTCAQDFQRYLERDPPRVSSREEFSRWMCEAHNDVNRKLGKEEFDCSRWEERWSTGWKDGRCD